MATVIGHVAEVHLRNSRSGSVCLRSTIHVGPAIKIGVDVVDYLVLSSPSVENDRRLLRLRCSSPTMTTVTPALWLARFAHLKDVCAKDDLMPLSKISGQR